MTEELRQLVVQVGTVAALVWSGWQASRAKAKATKAAHNTERMGNGFAPEVTESLHRIESKVGRVGSQLSGHLDDHARGRALWVVPIPRRRRRRGPDDDERP